MSIHLMANILSWQKGARTVRTSSLSQCVNMLTSNVTVTKLRKHFSYYD